MSATEARVATTPTRVLVDTNVLVYLWDARFPEKTRTATRLMSELEARSAGVHSTQTLGEFFVVATRKLPSAVPPHEAGKAVALLAESWPVLAVTPEVTLDAVRGSIEHGMQFWDAQLWATARAYGVGLVLSEDFADGGEIEGVSFANPFVEGFDLVPLIPKNASDDSP
jgi:predicted nucleic acid-binding protein